MTSRVLPCIALIFLFLMMVSCSGGNSDNNSFPTTPGLAGESTAPDKLKNGNQALWGFYDVTIDIESGTATATPNRNLMFTANVVQFVNQSPANLSFEILDTTVKTQYIDVDINVGITHPFAALPQYKGYDVRGVFIGDGNKPLMYNPAVVYAGGGDFQTMLDDPEPNTFPGDLPGGGPDGYTRWYNPTEFQKPGLFGYTPGIFATSGYSGTATLNPYKYFADGLAPGENAFDFCTTTDNFGAFSDGVTNTRNYYIRFPSDNDVSFNYAIIASWKGESEEMHPANAPEPVVASVSVLEGLYYEGPSNNGGYLIFDFSLFDWGAVISTIQNDYNLKLESSVLNSVIPLDSSNMITVGGNEVYSTFHVEIESDYVDGIDGQNFILIAELDTWNHNNNFGVPNDAGDDPLAAYFKYDVPVNPGLFNYPPYVYGIEDDIIGGGFYKSPVDYFDTAVTYTALFTDLDPGDTHTFEWYICDDGQPPNFTNFVTMPIDWSTYLPGNYDIHVFVNDGTDITHGGPYPIKMNTAPIISSGVDGKTDPLILGTETYSVTATDPDPGQSLSYTWTLIDMNGFTPVPGYNNVPGDGAGNLDIDWTAIGADDDHDWRITCEVSDGMDESDATPLDVTTTVNLYYGDYTNGEENMILNYSYPGYPDGVWTYDESYEVWKESNTPYTSNGYYRYTRTRMRTPYFKVPAGIAAVKIDVRQWFETIDGGDYCQFQYTTNGGSSWGAVVTLPHPGGGSSNYDILDTYTVPTAIFNKPSAGIGMYFHSDFDTTILGTGWNVRELRVYIEP